MAATATVLPFTPLTAQFDQIIQRDTMTNSTFTSGASFSKLAFLITRSALHVGCGEALGDVDQPVARQPGTQMPYIPGQALKRSCKDHAGLDTEQLALLFGNDQGRAGHLAPQDASLLLLPVASGRGGQAWVTSPSLLISYFRKASACGAPSGPWPSTSPQEGEVVLADSGSPLLDGTGPQSAVQLGAYRLSTSAPSKDWASSLGLLVSQAFASEDPQWQALVLARTVVVHDDMMLSLAKQLDVCTRNVIGDDGVAINLWREESVPEDSVFYTPLVAHAADSTGQRHGLKAAQQWLSARAERPLMLQVGGNASLGQGWMRLHLGRKA
jgi:CRISPR-associated protein Cmr4